MCKLTLTRLTIMVYMVEVKVTEDVRSNITPAHDVRCLKGRGVQQDAYICNFNIDRGVDNILTLGRRTLRR